MNGDHPTRRTVVAMGALALLGAAVASAEASPLASLARPGTGVNRSAGAVRSWSDPAAWPNGRVPGPRDVAVIAGPVPVVLSSGARVAGVRVEPGAQLHFDPFVTTLLESTGNVVVQGRLVMRPSSRMVTHRLRFSGIDEQACVGGGHQVLDSDVGLWVMEEGVLDAVGTPVVGWNRTGNDPTWLPQDEIWAAPSRAGDNTGFKRHLPGRVLETIQVGRRVLSTETFNVTRNVVIGGTSDGRAHVAFMHAKRPQVLQWVRVEHVGPRRRASDGVDDLVNGRYGLHFHHCGDGSRGSRVEGVVVAHSGSRAFVPHASNGIAFRDCVAWDTADEAYWWDPEPTKAKTYPLDASFDVHFDRCAAFLVGAQPRVRKNNTKSAFRLGQGTGNKCTDSVAAGVVGTGIHSSGFHWPENSGAKSGVWEFSGCVAHHNRGYGIFAWQNDPWRRSHHVIEDFAAYHNDIAGVKHGAYLNQYTYRRVDLADNGTRVSKYGQLLWHIGWGNTISDVVLDAAQRNDHALVLSSHRTWKDLPVVVTALDLRGSRRQPILVAQGDVPGSFDFVRSTVDGVRDLEPRDFLLQRLARGSRFRVQRRDGSAYQIDDAGRVAVIAAFAPRR